MNLKRSSVGGVFATVVLLAMGVSSSAHAQLIWTGSVSSDPSVAGNWSGTPPTISASNANGLWTTTSVPLDYASADGITTLGTSAGSYQGLSWIGQGATSTVSVTGGTLSLNGAFGNDGGTESVWVGNGGFTTSNLTINGGTVTALNGTLLGRDNAGGNISVSNGSYTTGVFSSSIGLSFNLNNNFGNGVVTIGNAGLFDVAGAALQPIMFQALTANSLNTSSSYINFTTGSTGTLQLNLSTATLGSSYFSDLVTNGYVTIGGTVDTTLGDYSINTSSLSASTLSLAVAPEPSTWALMVGGLVALGFIARRRVRI